MSRFDPSFDRLPASIPIFPLAGALLLPRGHLPLNIFEPRYLTMIEDALAADRMIGMIQPDETAPPLAGEPGVFAVGCAGRIVNFEETEDGRFLITLKGVSRFQVGEELATTRGYRKAVTEWTGFAGDLAPEDPVEIDRTALMDALRAYFKLQGIKANWDALSETPDERLVTSLSMICPFEPSEKQALLEAPGLFERAEILKTLVQMAALDSSSDDSHKARQ